MKLLRLCKRILPLLLVLLTLLPASSCSGSFRKKVHLKSYSVKYVVPTSARTADLVVKLEVENKTVGFTVTDIEGQIKLQDVPLARFKADDVYLKARTTEVYELPIKAELCEGISILRILMLVGLGGSDGLTADIDARVAKAGLSRKVSVKDKPVSVHIK